MIWTLWALLLISHGAFSRWVKTASRYALMSTLGDALLIAIGLITVGQLQELGAVDALRIGAFFIAFGVAGRQMMGTLLAGPRSVQRR